MTADELAEVTEARRTGDRKWLARCPACGYARALRIEEGGPDERGRPRVLTTCYGAACSFVAVLRAAGVPFTGAPAAPAPAPLPRRDAPTDAERSAWALGMWERSLPPAGTTVAGYLATRGLSLPGNDCIRFLPNAWHSDTDTRHPCMIAAVLDVAGELVAVHRTYLAPDGSAKADVDPCKKSLGPTSGGAVRLGEAKPGRSLVVAEGVETGLAAGALFDLPAWSAVSAGGIERLELPADVRSVFIVADADPAGRRCAHAAASRFRREERRVEVCRPDLGCNDANDLLLRIQREDA